MRSLHVRYIGSLSDASIQRASSILDSLERHSINHEPWDACAHKPIVDFRIAHSGNTLFLKFFVVESTVRALYFRPNEPVYKDSCVEFFIGIDNDREYYNFEFNAIGTCKLNYGINRNNRKLIEKEAISAIRFMTTITNDESKGGVSWQITIAIPVGTLTEHDLASFHGHRCRGNFYKCGDDLPDPHFLAWNNITAPMPDFHVPECFGDIVFD